MGVTYDDGLFGRKRKKKLSLGVKECRLDSPCDSPEMVISALIDDSDKHHPKLFHSDSFSVDGSGTFSPVDMEGFYEIDLSSNGYGGSMTAGEDIMLSSSSSALKDLGTGINLPTPAIDEARVSPSTSSASESRLQSEFEQAVDDLLDNSKDLELSMPAQDLLTDFTYLLSDIPSHPDLSCDDSEVIGSLLTYCSDKNDSISSSCASDSQTTCKKEPLSSIKCEIDDDQDIASSADCPDFDSLCKNSIVDDIDSQMSDYTNTLSCGCRGHDCLCYKYDSGSAEEDDAAVEYILSQRQSRARKVKRRRANGVRRGPGRPRKYENTEFVRRGPGRPRKKSVSDAVVWYQSRRKRTVSFSRSRSRQKSSSDDQPAAQETSMHMSQSGSDNLVQLKRSNRRDAEGHMSPTKCLQRFPSSHSSETDEEDIVDVESIGEEFQEIYGVSTMAELVQHISMMHSYHAQRFMVRQSTDCPSPQKSTSKFSINLAMPAKASWRGSDDGRRRRLSLEARSKREALNDLERRRRYALARELSALRDVVPEMREGFRAAKVVILAAAENHIRLLERKLRRDQSILKAERERNATLRARLQELSARECK